MTALHGQLADHILTHPLQSATMGIEELAKASGVSIATVNRFVRSLGLSGYADFRARSVEAFRRTIAPVEKLRDRESDSDEPAAIFADSLRATLGNVEASIQTLNSDACELATEMILRARTVAIIGLGVSAPLAQLTAELLDPFCRSQQVLDGWAGEARTAQRAMRLGEGDLVIAITLPRYSRAVLDLTRSLRAQGAQVLGITDAPTSPIVPFCDAALFGSAQHPLLHASIGGVVATIEGLVSVLIRKRQTVSDAAEIAERIYPYLIDDDAEAGDSQSPPTRRGRRPRRDGSIAKSSTNREKTK